MSEEVMKQLGINHLDYEGNELIIQVLVHPL